MKTNNVFSAPLPAAPPQMPPAALPQLPLVRRHGLRIVRHTRDTAISESEVFSLLTAKEEAACDLATD